VLPILALLYFFYFGHSTCGISNPDPPYILGRPCKSAGGRAQRRADKVPPGAGRAPPAVNRELEVAEHRRGLCGERCAEVMTKRGLL
jgi:hypothetical protein